METWTKYTFICDPEGCDALAEYTVKDTYVLNKDVTNVTCLCGQTLELLSVHDATISPINQPEQKEDKMTTMTDSYRQELELTYGNRVTELENELSSLRQNREYWLAENGRIGGQLIDLVNEFYNDSYVEASDVVTKVCEIIDYQPKKEIQFTATITFTGRIDVDASEAEDFDLTDALSEVYVDINNGDVVIDSYDLDMAEEN